MATKLTKWPYNLPISTKFTKNGRNGRKIYPHRPLLDTPKFTQTGSFGLEICHLATLLRPQI
jgi:hypothetical protein